MRLLLALLFALAVGGCSDDDYGSDAGNNHDAGVDVGTD
jgi:hypothetical protein